MKNLNELKERKEELQGGTILEFVAGKTISDMLTAEKQTVEKINFVAKKAELARQGKPFVLVAEPGRETMEEAIVNFCKEQTRQKRQAEFFSEIYELHDIKLEIKAITKLEADPRIARIRRIVEAVSDADANYAKGILVDGLTEFTRAEKAYIYQNILNMDIENDKDDEEAEAPYWYRYNILCDGSYKNGVIEEDCEDYAESIEALIDGVTSQAYDENPDYTGELEVEITDSDDPDWE